MILTRSPLNPPPKKEDGPVRLACVKHAASVRSEPGSNSPVQCLANHFDQTLVRSLKTNFLARSFCSVFKDQAPGSSPSQSPPFYPITKDLSNPFPLPQKLFLKTRDPRLTPSTSPRSSRAALIPHPSNTCQKISGQKSTALLHHHNLIAKIKQNHNQGANSTLKDEPEKRATSGVLPPVAGDPMDRGIAPEPAPPPVLPHAFVNGLLVCAQPSCISSVDRKSVV